jgi:hypothetical protein
LNTKIIGLLATLLIPFLLPLLIRKYGLKVPARKWVVWYIFWIVLASLVAYQIFTIRHDLLVIPTTLDFGESETEMSLTVTNNGTGVIRWEISKPGLNWISVVPDSGAVGAEKDIVTISINRSMVPQGPINVKFHVVGRAGENATVTVRVVG